MQIYAYKFAQYIYIYTWGNSPENFNRIHAEFFSTICGTCLSGYVYCMSAYIRAYSHTQMRRYACMIRANVCTRFRQNFLNNARSHARA